MEGNITRCGRRGGHKCPLKEIAVISRASSKLVILGVRHRLALHKLLSRTKGSLTRYRPRRFSRLVESAFARLQFTKPRPRLSNVATCSAAVAPRCMQPSHATSIAPRERNLLGPTSAIVASPPLPGRKGDASNTNRVHSALDPHYLSAKTRALEETSRKKRPTLCSVHAFSRQLERALIPLESKNRNSRGNS